MNSTESGYAKSVANFESLVVSCESFGQIYAPVREELQPAQLRAALAKAQESLRIFREAVSANKHAIARREEAFDDFSKKITRVQAGLRSSRSSEFLDERAKSVVRTLRGQRAGASSSGILVAEAATGEGAASVDSSPTPRTGSVSRLSYDNRLANFQQLIELLVTTPEYTPSHPDLQIAGLKTYAAELAQLNSEVVATDAALSYARKLRDEALSQPGTGLHDLAMDVKDYVLSQCGSASPEYHRVVKVSIR